MKMMKRKRNRKMSLTRNIEEVHNLLNSDDFEFFWSDPILSSIA